MLYPTHPSPDSPVIPGFPGRRDFILSLESSYGPTFQDDRMGNGRLLIGIACITHQHCHHYYIIKMGIKMMGAVVVATLVPLFVNAREGPECPADPYVSVFGIV
jgi:hypothetical protein